MANQRKPRMKPGWERIRENGRFARDQAKPIAPQPVRHTKAYSQLRNAAMRLMRNLEKMMPAENSEDADGAAPPSLSPEFERLLGRSDGVIDGFNTLALLVIRLIDKERESRGTTKKASPTSSRLDDEELDQRIAAELDLIAERRGGERHLQEDPEKPEGETGGVLELGTPGAEGTASPAR
jgi:hypothetical protein